ncbi:MAG TPA: ATP-grasp fold amidoligase family protein [Methylomirabilota bacterium]|nr:ATP-grasp fold amidoligase family protein [Methylomirabilota bacterium]
MPDRVILARRYRRIFGRRLNLWSPKTFNEKLYWLMLYYRPPLATTVSDKYAVRAYVAERTDSAILNDLYGVWDRAEDVDFDALPEAFVLKVNWGWRMNMLCPRKGALDLTATRAQLSAWMEHNLYWTTREWSYKNIRPRIICERLLLDEAGGAPTEYSFFCFGGQPAFLRAQCDRATHVTADTFDMEWRIPPFVINRPNTGRVVDRPSSLDAMADHARRLSAGWPFMRVDLYDVDGHIVFGELTLYPGAGTNRFTPVEYDRYWGDAIQLPGRQW